MRYRLTNKICIQHPGKAPTLTSQSSQTFLSPSHALINNSIPATSINNSIQETPETDKNRPNPTPTVAQSHLNE